MCCDYATVAGNVEISDSGETMPVLCTSDEVPLKVERPASTTAANAAALQPVEEAKIQAIKNASSVNTHSDSKDGLVSSLAVKSGCTACNGGKK
jgi:hypothetical protein